MDKFAGILRAIVPAGVAYAAGKGYIASGSEAEVAAAITAIFAAGWSITSKVKKPSKG